FALLPAPDPSPNIEPLSLLALLLPPAPLASIQGRDDTEAPETLPTSRILNTLRRPPDRFTPVSSSV
ncbi:MAG: hypothetical protein LQ348_000152, partial [Seirophora lacunosa]